jgi:light-regulated signal transduction histidine kinase (bacteriophytochrome)
MIDDLLRLARIGRGDIHRVSFDLSALAHEVASHLRNSEPGRDVALHVEGGMVVDADPPLVQIVLENLLGNAWKFTANRADAAVEFGARTEGGETRYFVRDNGAGFDMAFAPKLFGVFQRLHAETEFAGTGVGLATVKRIVGRHDGRVWADSEIGRGATFYFTLHASSESRRSAS